MGWTSVRGMTADELRAEELRGCTIVKKTGSWYLITREGMGQPAALIYFMARRYGDEVAVKDVSIEMGPGVTPPRAIAKAYVDFFGGDIDKAGGTYGADLLREALEGSPTAKIKVGDTFRFEGERQWSDGHPWAGEYVWLGKYRALRSDGRTVQLPRSWRRQAVA